MLVLNFHRRCRRPRRRQIAPNLMVFVDLMVLQKALGALQKVNHLRIGKRLGYFPIGLDSVTLR